MPWIRPLLYIGFGVIPAFVWYARASELRNWGEMLRFIKCRLFVALAYPLCYHATECRRAVNRYRIYK